MNAKDEIRVKLQRENRELRFHLYALLKSYEKIAPKTFETLMDQTYYQKFWTAEKRVQEQEANKIK